MILRDAYKKLEGVTSFGYSAKLEMEVNKQTLERGEFMTPIAAKEYVGFGITLDGGLDLKDIEEVKSLMNVHIVTYGMGKDSITVDAETRTIGDNLYMMLTRLPASVGAPFSYLKDKWIHINVDELQKKYSLPIQEKGKPLTKDQEKRIQKLFEDPDLFTVKQNGSEMINDVDSYRFSVEFDRYALRNVIKEYYKIINEGELNKRERQEMAKTFDKMVVKETELWIGKKDHMIYRINTTIVFDTKEGDVAVPIKVRLKDHNKPVDVDKPRNAKELEELMQEVIQEYYYGELQKQYQGSYFPSKMNVLGTRIDKKKEEQVKKEFTSGKAVLERQVAQGVFGQYLLYAALGK